jgi:RNA polymerase sigma factor (sigma-70 family)
MRTVTIPAARAGHLPRRLLALSRDEHLVEQIRRGSEAAFEVAYERHSGQILSFCRHMLGSREEAEDAVQHTFAAAHAGLLGDGREIRLKPWLYAIARNRCLSILRTRREEAAEDLELQTAGLDDEVQRRAELRELLGDLRDLPAEQREALLLAELGDLPHADIAAVLGCEVPRVKALVFRARSGLIQRRDARDMPCVDVRAQLANLRGGSLRRSELKHHLRACAGCRDFREEVRRQRQLMAAVLPVFPSAGLKAGVLSAIGIGGGSAGGAAGGGMAALGGSSALAKLAVAGAIVGAGAVAGGAALDGGGAHPDGGAGAPAAAAEPAVAARERPVAARTPTRRAGTPSKRAGHDARRRAAARRSARKSPPGTRILVPGVSGRERAQGHGNGLTKAPKKPKKVKVKPAPRPAPPKAKAPPAAPPAQPVAQDEEGETGGAPGNDNEKTKDKKKNAGD